jgi:hypothetical protein
MSKQLFVPLENLVFKNPAADPAPTDVSYPEEARRLLPLIGRLADGGELSSSQLADIAVGSWRIIEMAQNLLELRLAKEQTRRTCSR